MVLCPYLHVVCSVAYGLNHCMQPPECHAVSRAAGDVLYSPEQVWGLLHLDCHATVMWLVPDTVSGHDIRHFRSLLAVSQIHHSTKRPKRSN